MVHTRNRHLRNHCGFSVAVSNGSSLVQRHVPKDPHFASGFPLEASNGISLEVSTGRSLSRVLARSRALYYAIV